MSRYLLFELGNLPRIKVVLGTDKLCLSSLPFVSDFFVSWELFFETFLSKGLDVIEFASWEWPIYPDKLAFVDLQCYLIVDTRAS